MGMFDQSNDFSMVSHAIHSIFLYAACTEDGFVKVGISRAPFDRIYSIHICSPSPVRAAQWVWVGSLQMGTEIEKRIRLEWDRRHTRGEWYRFDYSKPEDKADFHDTLGAVVEVVTGKAPKWEKLGPCRVDELITAGNQLRDEKVRAARKKRARA